MSRTTTRRQQGNI